MSIDYESTLIFGFILPETYDEDKVDDLCHKLNCMFVSFNEGYDTLFQYALVPSCLETDTTIDNKKVLLDLYDEVQKIKESADALGIKLPEPTLCSRILVW
jgi:hypothetical protein